MYAAVYVTIMCIMSTCVHMSAEVVLLCTCTHNMRWSKVLRLLVLCKETHNMKGKEQGVTCSTKEYYACTGLVYAAVYVYMYTTWCTGRTCCVQVLTTWWRWRWRWRWRWSVALYTHHVCTIISCTPSSYPYKGYLVVWPGVRRCKHFKLVKRNFAIIA